MERVTGRLRADPKEPMLMRAWGQGYSQGQGLGQGSGQVQGQFEEGAGEIHAGSSPSEHHSP